MLHQKRLGAPAPRALCRKKQFGEHKLLLLWPRLASPQPFLVLEKHLASTLAIDLTTLTSIAESHTHQSVVMHTSKRVINCIASAAKGRRRRRLLSSLSVQVVLVEAAAYAMSQLGLSELAAALTSAYGGNIGGGQGGALGPKAADVVMEEAFTDPGDMDLMFEEEEREAQAATSPVRNLDPEQADDEGGEEASNGYLEDSGGGSLEEPEFLRRLPEQSFTDAQLSLQYSIQRDHMPSALVLELEQFAEWSVSPSQLNRGRYKPVQECTLGKQVRGEMKGLNANLLNPIFNPPLF